MKVNLTQSRVEAFTCPPEKAQAFMWDTAAPGLGVRATFGGKNAFVFQSTHHSKSLRLTIGGADVWALGKARERARELQTMLDRGIDPREAAREARDKEAEQHRQKAAQGKTFAEAWAAYLEERKQHWGERHYADHVALARAGGEKPKNGRKGLTKPGPIAELMHLRLIDLTPEILLGWAKKQAKSRPTVARLALRNLKAFLNWCQADKELQASLTDNAAKSKKVREELGSPKAKKDVLLKAQVADWFREVEELPLTASAYLQVLVLTGGRPGEVIGLKWTDVDERWKTLVMRDKVEGTRKIGLTEYVSHLLGTLPRRIDKTGKANPYVFASPRTSSHLTRVDPLHIRACTAAGIQGLTLHGLRRTFKNMSEWIEVPAGVVAQIQGHKPSATIEKHYVERELGLLAQYQQSIEDFILQEAGIAFQKPAKEERKLRVVGGGNAE